MTKAMVHLIEGNVAALVDDAVDLDFLPDDIDRAALVPILGRVFDGARLAAKSMDGVPVQKRRKEFAAVSSDLNNIFFEQPFRVPDYFALVARGRSSSSRASRWPATRPSTSSRAYPHGLRRAREAVRRRGAGIAAAAGRARCSGARRRGTDADRAATCSDRGEAERRAGRRARVQGSEAHQPMRSAHVDAETSPPRKTVGQRNATVEHGILRPDAYCRAAILMVLARVLLWFYTPRIAPKCVGEHPFDPPRSRIAATRLPDRRPNADSFTLFMAQAGPTARGPTHTFISPSRRGSSLLIGRVLAGVVVSGARRLRFLQLSIKIAHRYSRELDKGFMDGWHQT